MTIVNGYCTAAQVKAQVGIPAADTTDDTRVELAINAASRGVDGYTGRRFWQDGSAIAREFYADDPMFAQVDDISTTSGLIVKVDTNVDGTFATTLTISTHFVLTPRNAAARVPVWPYTGIQLTTGSIAYLPSATWGRATLQVTAKFGWPAIPDDVTLATTIHAARLFKQMAPDAYGSTAIADDKLIAGMLEPYCLVRLS